jgi:hypothetical protein
MEALITGLVVFAVATLVLGGALLALVGLEGTCSRQCDGSGRALCDFCPRRRAPGEGSPGGRRGDEPGS